MTKNIILMILLLVAMSAVCAQAVIFNLSAYATSDNAFDAYISTDDTVAGTHIGSGGDWDWTYSFFTPLTQGVTNYLHIVGYNWGGPAGFIGTFDLNSTDFVFANGTQHLNTNTVDWQVSLTNFGTDYFTPTSFGTNASGIWGYHGSIDPSAEWIWSPNLDGNVYFSTPIRATTKSDVPEFPASLLAVIGSMAAMLLKRRR